MFFQVKIKAKKARFWQLFLMIVMVLVEGVNMSTKHKKPRSRYQQGGIIHQESPINSAKVMLVCERCESSDQGWKKVFMKMVKRTEYAKNVVKL